jgi:3-deoxy-D-manno-octulosonic-acid transferase
MSLILDALYLFALLAVSPWLAWRAARTGRYRHGLREKLLGRLMVPPDDRPTAWFHGVSVGEVHLLATLVGAFRRRHPGWRVVVSSTTDTGLSEARARFPDLPVVPFPVDLSWAVGRALGRVNPRLVVLAEGELWPNFLRAAGRQGVPVAVANARLSPRTFARMRRLKWLARPLLLDRVTVFAAQSDDTADRLRSLGVPAGRVVTTGSVKFDGATGDRDAPKAVALRALLNRRDELVWVAGSTHPPEEELVLAAFARLRTRLPGLRLVLVPRHPDRFEAVAGLAPMARRSRLAGPVAEMPAVTLLDTVGELGAAWGLADVGYVGGSLDGRRGGQSMIEPAGYGVPAVFGPHVWNFRDAARLLVECGGAVQVADAAAMEAEIGRLLADPAARRRMGQAARELVRQQQGATARTLDALPTGG